MPDSGLCPLHHVEWKTVPAGVSRKTGRPYNAFKRCPVEGCEERPPRPAAAPRGTSWAPRPGPQGSPVSGQPSPSDATLALKAACLHFAGLVFSGTGHAEDAKMLAAEVFANWKEKA